ITGKPEMVKDIQDMVNAIFTLVSCRFHEFNASPEIYPKYITAATGMDIDLEGFKRTGEKIWNLERLFNTAAGFERKDDALPDRCFEPIKGENSESAVMVHGQFDEMLSEYYRIRGWDDNGIPTDRVLDELGLGEYEALKAVGGG
ncbi:MAG: aldehyde ferredoxin oxidoreductase, partial [Spirochaetales bacterium]|nr:aldehyde ferredoxin oxidoreductase [Spirochaetales bacterium]